MTDNIVALALYAYSGSKLCMGYPIEKKGHTPAEYWFETPEIIRHLVENSLPKIYLCEDCAQAFVEEVAMGIMWVKDSRDVL